MSDSFPMFDVREVHQSIETGVVPKISPTALRDALALGRDVAVVDVRAAEDFAKGHVPGAVNLPLGQWNEAAGLSKDRVTVVYSYDHRCPLGGAACAELAGRGYPVVDMDGGFDIWQASESMPDS